MKTIMRNLFALTFVILVSTVAVRARKFNMMEKRLTLLEQRINYEVMTIKDELDMIVGNLSDIQNIQDDKNGNNQEGISKSAVRHLELKVNAMQRSTVNLNEEVKRGFLKEKKFLRETLTELRQELQLAGYRIMVLNQTVNSNLKQCKKNADDLQLEAIKQKYNLEDLETRTDVRFKESELFFSSKVDTLNQTMRKETGVFKTLSDDIITNDIKQDTRIEYLINQTISSTEEIESLKLGIEENASSLKGFAVALDRSVVANSNLIDNMKEEIRQYVNGMLEAVMKEQCSLHRSSKYFEQSCYMLVLDAKTWHQAKDVCKASGFHLVEIGTERENSFIVKHVIPSGYQLIWIGADDIRNEGAWEWSFSGQSLNKDLYSKWGYGEPSNGGGNEDCLALNKRPRMGTHYNFWNDDLCTKKFYFVCEKEF